MGRGAVDRGSGRRVGAKVEQLGKHGAVCGPVTSRAKIARITSHTTYPPDAATARTQPEHSQSRSQIDGQSRSHENRTAEL
jgi:hypothetical protein